MFDEQETDKFELAPELVAVQNKLANLSPKALRIDRDQLMFNAGRAAERASSASQSDLAPYRTASIAGATGSASARAGATGSTSARPGATGSASARFWPLAAMTAAATFLISVPFFWQRPVLPIADHTTSPQSNLVVESTDLANEPSLPPVWSPRPNTGYLAVRNIALAHGVGAIGAEFDAQTPVAPPSSEPTTAPKLLDDLLPSVDRQRG